MNPQLPQIDVCFLSTTFTTVPFIFDMRQVFFTNCLQMCRVHGVIMLWTQSVTQLLWCMLETLNYIGREKNYALNGKGLPLPKQPFTLLYRCSLLEETIVCAYPRWLIGKTEVTAPESGIMMCVEGGAALFFSSVAWKTCLHCGTVYPMWYEDCTARGHPKEPI